MVLNADDFGLDDAVNRGIVDAFQAGFVSSTTLMANQPGFLEAVELAHENRLQQHVGVHLVLTCGTPLTPAIRRSRRFCDDEGEFRNWRLDARALRLSRHERAAVVDELRTQILRVRESGLPVTHVDSHHHVHTEWGIGSCVIVLCKRLDIPWVRLARNCGPRIRALSKVYKRAFNRRLQRHRLAATAWFGNVEDWLHLQGSGASAAALYDFELMTHPQRSPQGELVDLETGLNLEALLAPVTAVGSATSYSGVARRASGEPVS